jgi:hypothetical protein
MKKIMIAIFGTAVSVGMLSFTAGPAYALGGCGDNGHRNSRGQCVFGGQNQRWCERTTGHPAVWMPNGTKRCFRH